MTTIREWDWEWQECNALHSLSRVSAKNSLTMKNFFLPKTSQNDCKLTAMKNLLISHSWAWNAFSSVSHHEKCRADSFACLSHTCCAECLHFTTSLSCNCHVTLDTWSVPPDKHLVYKSERWRWEEPIKWDSSHFRRVLVSLSFWWHICDTIMSWVMKEADFWAELGLDRLALDS